MRYLFRLGLTAHHVHLEEHAEGPRFIVEGSSFEPRVERLGRGRYAVTIDDDSWEFTIEHGTVHEGPKPLDLEVQRAKPEVIRVGGAGKRRDGSIKPPMPGKVVEVQVSEGDEVEEGSPLLVLEAMKMQNDLKAPIAGTVTRVLVKPGQNVEATTVLLEIEPAA